MDLSFVSLREPIQKKSKRWINDFIMLKMNPNLELLRQSSSVWYEFYFGRYCTLSNYTGYK